MQAIILVGGLGTRLRSVVCDVPKPMALIQDKPFLAYLLDYLSQQGITEVVLSAYYLSEKIQDYFRSSYCNMKINYAIEEEPLGTGGAMAHALSKVSFKKSVFVINGDTFLKMNYQKMWETHCKKSSLITIALKQELNVKRYGTVAVKDDVVIEFQEKQKEGIGLINAGIYLIQPDLFKLFSLPKTFSFEKDFLFPKIKKIKPQAFVVDDYFIDIGVPEDYQRALREFPKIF